MQLSPPMYRRAQAQQGFTLPEVLVASLLSILAITAFLAFSRAQLFALRNQANQVDLQTAARSVIDVFAREVRKAGANPGCAIGGGFSGVAFASARQLRVQSDFDNDGDTIDVNEDLTYAFLDDSDVIQRTDNNSGTTDGLVSGYEVQGALRYFTAAGAELTPPTSGLSAANRALVRRVRLELSLEGGAVDPLNPMQLRAQMATDVDLRNRYFLNSTACPGT